MDIVQKKDVRSFTMLHIDFLDCETLSSNEKILLAILMRYSYYGKNSPSATFPSFAGLAKKTGLAEKAEDPVSHFYHSCTIYLIDE